MQRLILEQVHLYDVLHAFATHAKLQTALLHARQKWTQVLLA